VALRPDVFILARAYNRRRSQSRGLRLLAAGLFAVKFHAKPSLDQVDPGTVGGCERALTSWKKIVAPMSSRGR
jgi:hypothetical protein